MVIKPKEGEQSMLLLPSLVYPSADLLTNLARTVMHAVIVLAEAGVLLLAILARKRSAV